MLSMLGWDYYVGWQVTSCQCVADVEFTHEGITTRYAVLRPFADINSLIIDGRRISDADQVIPWLKWQPRLADLTLYGNGFSNRTCALIAECCPNLMALSLHSDYDGGGGMARPLVLSTHDRRQLARLASLDYLLCSGTIEAGGLEELARLPRLRTFSYCPDAPSTTRVSFQGLGDFDALERLALDVTPAELQTFLGDLPDDRPVLARLKQLSFYSENVDHGGRSARSYGEFSAATLRQLTRFGNLTVLRLSEKVGDHGVRHLESLTNLRELQLSFCRVTDVDCKSLTKLANLEKFNLEHTNITIEGLQELSRLPHLRELRIGQCRQIRDPSEIDSLPKSFLSRCRVVR